MTELRLCPFCGGEGKTSEKIVDYNGKIIYEYTCYCAKCFCSTPPYPIKDDAIRVWNTRLCNHWHTGTPTEDEDYLVAFHPWGRKENGICYIGLKWEEDHWYDPVTDYFSEPYLVAWQKITPCKENEMNLCDGCQYYRSEIDLCVAPDRDKCKRR